MKLFRYLLIAALLLAAPSAFAAGRSEWTAGNGVGFTWTAMNGTTDVTSLASGSSVLSSATAVANQTALDLYADISVKVTITSATPTAGGTIAVYILPLNADGSSYGDTHITTTQAAYVPPMAPACVVPLTATATTIMSGVCTNVLLPPGTFQWAFYNASGLTFSGTDGNNVFKYRTYNLQLNN